jgi:hypothetical protein
MLIGTWRTTRENNATTRVEWDALSQVIRKARERLPYPKGASREASLLEYREVLRCNTPGFKGQSRVHLIHAPKKTTYIITECIEIDVTI